MSVFPGYIYPATVVADAQRRRSQEVKKQLFIATFVLPFIESAAQALALLDTNSTGKDDRAAQALRVAASALREFLTSPDETQGTSPIV